MQSAAYREHMLESAIVDFAEARLLQDRVRQVFHATVINLRRDGVEVQITDPPVRAVVRSPLFALDALNPAAVRPVLSKDQATLKLGTVQLSLGQTVALRLDAADPATRSVRFTPVPL
jgi:exoribonuclease R